MSDIYVKAAATLHELFAQRKEIAAQAGKLDSVHDTAAEDSKEEQQRAITVAETVTDAALKRNMQID